MNIDKYNLKKVIQEEYTQIKDGLALAGDIKFDHKFESIMISGMGGSALPGNVLRIFINSTYKGSTEKRLQVFQNRFYNLPVEAYGNCLNIISSYSGNTEETISAFQECLDNNLPCVGISNGGKVKEMCLANNIPHIELPYPFDNFQPRMATGYSVLAMFKLLINSNLIKFDVSQLDGASEKLRLRMDELEESGKKLAKKLVGKTPIIYSGTRFKSIANIWKIKINENSKTPAFWGFFPELNHNEMVGFTNPQSKFFFVMLLDEEDHPQNIKRFKVMKDLMAKKGMESEIIKITGEDVFEKVFTSLCLGDWASYYLALEYGIDPTPVDMVEEFKELIK